jgi:GNAT superfamily N-acetyltransferase
MALYARVVDEAHRESEDAIVRNLAGPARRAPGGHIVVSATDAAGACVGGAIFSYLPSIDCGYASYLFVAEGARGRRIGSRLLTETRRALEREAAEAARPPVQGVFTEVKQLGGDASTSTLHRFWRRNGVYPLGIEWEYPPLHPGATTAATYLAFGSYRETRRTWYPAELERVVRAIFEATYDYLPEAGRTLAIVAERLHRQPQDQPIRYAAWPAE